MIRFKQSKKKNIDLEQLKAAVRAQLEKMIRINKTRADYLAKFEELIAREPFQGVFCGMMRIGPRSHRQSPRNPAKITPRRGN